MDQFDTNPFAHIQPLEPLDQPSLQRRLKKTHPGTLGGRTGDQGLKALPDPRFEEQRGGRFPDLTLHFPGGIL